MESKHRAAIRKAYTGFNVRDIDSVFPVMSAEIHWPQAFEGGYVAGYQVVRAYGTKQWSEINPMVEPVAISQRPDGKVEVLVNQLVTNSFSRICKSRSSFSLNNASYLFKSNPNKG